MLASPRPLQLPSGQASGAGLPESFQLPASLCVGLRFSPEQFAQLCQANPERASSWTRSGSGRSTIVPTVIVWSDHASEGSLAACPASGCTPCAVREWAWVKSQ